MWEETGALRGDPRDRWERVQTQHRFERGNPVVVLYQLCHHAATRHPLFQIGFGGVKLPQEGSKDCMKSMKL